MHPEQFNCTSSASDSNHLESCTTASLGNGTGFASRNGARVHNIGDMQEELEHQARDDSAPVLWESTRHRNGDGVLRGQAVLQNRQQLARPSLTERQGTCFRRSNRRWCHAPKAEVRIRDYNRPDLSMPEIARICTDKH